MRPLRQQLQAVLITLAVASSTPVSGFGADSGDHVVPLTELHQQAAAAASQRAKNLADINRVLSLPEAQQEIARTNLKADQVTTAISQLNDEELARLANRARSAEADVRGGFGIFSIFTLIGIIVVVVVLVAVFA
jgi:hypothetical protein